jgi:hypothetical protein
MKMLLLGAAVVLSAAAIHAQAELTGRWQGQSPAGSQVVFDVKATQTTLTGTLRVDGQQLPIADGKVSDKTFTFTVSLPPNDAIQEFTGEVTQDEVKLWMDRRGPASAAVLKRVKD